MKKLALVCITISSFGLFGCKSTPDQIDTQPLMTNHSEAYNIANQTALLRDKSPLKDFTLEEVAAIQTELTKQSNGGKYVAALGALSVLSGNLTGVIDIAGGSAAMIANSNHAASEPRWIIAVPQSNFASIEDAQVYVQDTIEAAKVQYLSQFGLVSTQDNPYSKGLRNTTLTIGSESYDVGFYTPVNTEIRNRVKGVVATTPLNNEPVYLFGADRRAEQSQYSVAGTFTPHALQVKGGVNQNYDEMMREFTSLLPSGFHLYSPSFPTQYERQDGGMTVKYSINKTVPSIYTEGRQLDFIKP
ncbi:hypothetical protein ST37_10500 [Vibrio sp. qd031]|uniref:hypothetical protein n=1 Tax=Vibrio sp. qd031 TaxID=1603038 RepID=UPI000A223441|nr:hypothetical protein [Vibrio sp. qd031]ORT50302.1 hypothetical protein ST37_10500 [Vibrio sp. qd031]